MSNIEIRTARSIPEIESLREAWVAWPTHRDSDIDFYQMIIGSYKEVLRPHVLALYRNGNLESILVGRLESKRLTFRVGYLSLCRPQVRCITFVYGAIHGNTDPENTSILLREVMSSLKQGQADVAMFEFVPVHSPLYALALEVPGFLCRDVLPSTQAHDLLAIPETFDEIWALMSGKRRKIIRQGIRKFLGQANGQENIICCRHECDLPSLFRDAEEVAKKTYQRGLGAGFEDSPAIRQRLALAAKRGWLRAYVLYLGQRPVAFWIGMLYGGTFVSEYLGYDPEFRQFSPGMFLIMRVIEGFCTHANDDIVDKLDFGLGHAEYKGVLSTTQWSEGSLFIFAPTAKGLAVKFTKAAVSFVDLSARKVLQSTNWLPKLKRVWRDHLSKTAAENQGSAATATIKSAVR